MMYANIKPEKLLQLKFLSPTGILKRNVDYHTEIQFSMWHKIDQEIYRETAKRLKVVVEVTYHLKFYSIERTIKYLPSGNSEL